MMLAVTSRLNWVVFYPLIPKIIRDNDAPYPNDLVAFSKYGHFHPADATIGYLKEVRANGVAVVIDMRWRRYKRSPRRIVRVRVFPDTIALKGRLTRHGDIRVDCPACRRHHYHQPGIDKCLYPCGRTCFPKGFFVKWGKVRVGRGGLGYVVDPEVV